MKEIKLWYIILQLKNILKNIPSDRNINDTDIEIRDLLNKLEKLENN